MDEAALSAFLAENLPSIAAAMQSMPAAMERFTTVVDTFAQSLEDYETINDVAFVPIVWTIIVGGAVALIAAIVGFVVGKRKPATA
jgi:hypothetical protein